MKDARLHSVQKGDPVSARMMNRVLQKVAMMGGSGSDCYVDGQGNVHSRRKSKGVDEALWGKLDADLEYDDSVGVTVSVWVWDDDTSAMVDSTTDITPVFPPLTMESGTIDSGSWVRVESIGGRLYVTMAPC